MENFDPEMMFPPSEDRIKLKNQIINDKILEFGISDDDSIIHFGCNFDSGIFTSHLLEKLNNIKYTGIDVTDIKPNGYVFENIDMQTKLDSIKSHSQENGFREVYDWVIITDIFNKNIYNSDQYTFVDAIIRESLHLSNRGIIIKFSTKHTEEDFAYNIGFFTSYLLSMYSRFDIVRVDETNYLICIYKWFY